jgi:acetyl/propionyl-CoA carboxylase alpha subunit
LCLQINAKRILSSHSASAAIPLIPGYNGDYQSTDTLRAKALGIGFPLLLKASAGGGGKGMRIVHNADGLLQAIESAKTESKNAFGDDALLIERYFDNVKHVEVCANAMHKHPLDQAITMLFGLLFGLLLFGLLLCLTHYQT